MGWEAHAKYGALAHFRFEGERAAVFFDDDGAGQGEALAGTFADFFRGEKRVEYFPANAFGDSGATILHGDDDGVAVFASSNDDEAFFTGNFHDVSNGVGRVDEQVQKDLIEISEMTRDRRQHAEIGFDFGYIFGFVPRDDQGAFDGFVEVGGDFIGAVIDVRKLFHGADDGGDAIHAVHHLLESFGNFCFEECPLYFGADRIEGLEEFGRDGAVAGPLRDFFVLGDHGETVAKGVLNEAGVVSDELNWGVDFVGDSGGQAADRFEFLRVTEFDFHLTLFGDVREVDDRAADLRAFEHRDGGIADREMRAVNAAEIIEVGGMAAALLQQLGQRAIGFRVGGTILASVMKQIVGVLANDAFRHDAQGAGSGTIDESDGAGEVHAVDAFGSGLENEDEFFANSFAFGLGDFARHELAHLAGDAHQKIAELFVHGDSFMAEEGHDAENCLKKTERHGEGAADSGGSGGVGPREVGALGYVFDRLRRARLPDASGKTFAELELDALAYGLKLEILGRRHAPELRGEQVSGCSVELPDFAEIVFQRFAEDAKNPVAGFGNILRFGQDAGDRELDVGLFAHAVTFDRVGQYAFVRGRVHAALDNVVVRAGANYFDSLNGIVNGGEDDDRSVFRGGDEALQAANTIGVRDCDVD